MISQQNCWSNRFPRDFNPYGYLFPSIQTVERQTLGEHTAPSGCRFEDVLVSCWKLGTDFSIRQRIKWNVVQGKKVPGQHLCEENEITFPQNVELGSSAAAQECDLCAEQGSPTDSLHLHRSCITFDLLIRWWRRSQHSDGASVPDALLINMTITVTDWVSAVTWYTFTAKIQYLM